MNQFYSEKLNCNIKFEPETNTYKVQDKVDPLFRTKSNYWMRYTIQEANRLKESGGMNKYIHNIKKKFNGTII